MDKKFKTIDEQINILRNRNLIINNYNKAYELLTRNNYYYLINGYKDLFLDKNSKNEKYIDNASIEEIYKLYIFDKNIKINFLKYILYIENEIDAYISYEFSKSYGHKNYLSLQNFNKTNLNVSQIKKFINVIKLEIAYQYRNSNSMIKHYLNKYGYVPLWVAIRVLSLGKISKFYALMKQKEQNTICRKYNLSISEFKIYLQNLTIIRNICAHDEKLYDIRLKNRILNTQYHARLKIRKNIKYLCGTRDLFSIVIILKVLLQDEQFIEFYNNLLNDIEKLQNSLISIKVEKVLSKMGFPKNYKKLLKL